MPDAHGLIFDATDLHAGKPMLHAIVIGVSDYGHLPAPGEAPTPGSHGLHKLNSAASSARDVATWLQARRTSLAWPLGTVRLCVAPRAAEVADSSRALPAGASGATRADLAQAINEWRAVQKPDDVALFYFAGHGLQRSRSDMVLLAADFAAKFEGPLSRAVDLTHVWEGMGRTDRSATIARTQLYFVDACRERPASLGKFEELAVPDIWGVTQLQGKDDRRAPIYYATTAGALAYADPAAATLFSHTLLECLDGGAAAIDDDSGAWQVTTKSLERALGDRFRAGAGGGTDQECDADHAFADFLIARLEDPPLCKVQLRVDPDGAVASARVTIQDHGQDAERVVHPLEPHPHLVMLPGGYYAFEAVSELGGAKVKTRLIEPSRPSWDIRFKVVP